MAEWVSVSINCLPMLKVKGLNPGFAVYFRDCDRNYKWESLVKNKSTQSKLDRIESRSIYFGNSIEVDILGGRA